MMAWTIIGVVIAGMVAIGGLIAWVAVLSYHFGRMTQRVDGAEKRLEKGDVTFAEMRHEQGQLRDILVELQAARKVETQKVALLHRQTRALLTIVAQLNPKAAPAAMAAAASGS